MPDWPDDLFRFLGKIFWKEVWSSGCLGSVPGNSFPGNKPSHPHSAPPPAPNTPPPPMIQDFLLYCSTTPFSEQVVGRKQQPKKDAGQDMARLLRIQPGCDKPGAEQEVNTEYICTHGTLGAGELEAEDRRQHGVCFGIPGNVSRFLPVGKHQGLKAEGSQPENPEDLLCVLLKPMLEVQRHPACSWHVLKVHRQTVLQFYLSSDHCTIWKPTLSCLVTIYLG